jgi:hypothetical protein
MKDYKGDNPRCPLCRVVEPVNKNIMHSCCACHSTNNVTLGPDPYNSVMNDDPTHVWKCRDCRHTSEISI